MMHPEYYEVLARVKSTSNPDKTYEIRKSNRDGKTYCTCPGWIHKARKTEGGMCKHLAKYIYEQAKEGVTVVAMKFSDFVRNKIDLSGKKLDDNLDIDRGKIER